MEHYLSGVTREK